MDESDSNIYFSELTDWEEHVSLNHLIKNKSHIILWESGIKEKWTVPVASYEEDDREIILSPVKGAEINYPDKVLFYFYIKNVYFFSEGMMTLRAAFPRDVLKIQRKILKYDIRKKFRFLISQSDRVSCKAIVKDDLSLFDIHDISVGGMSIIINQEEMALFSEGEMIKNIKILFNETTLVITESKISYIVDIKGSKSDDQRRMKVGFHFVNIASHIDNQLGALINKFLTKIDLRNTFENLLK